MQCSKINICAKGQDKRCIWLQANQLLFSLGLLCAQMTSLAMGEAVESAFPRQQMVLAPSDNSDQASTVLSKPKDATPPDNLHNQTISQHTAHLGELPMQLSETSQNQPFSDAQSNQQRLVDSPSLPTTPDGPPAPSIGSVLQQVPMVLLQHSDDLAFSHWTNACQQIATDMFTFSASHVGRDKHRLSSFFMPKAWAVLDQALFLSPQAFLRPPVLEHQHDTLGVGVDAPALRFDGSYSLSGRQRASFETTVMAVEYAKPFQKRVFKVQMQVVIARPGDRQNGLVLVESVNIQPMSDWGRGVQV